jgi:hypothetical protein
MPALRRALTILPCPTCGWQPGLGAVALAQTADGPVTTFVAERRHRLMLTFGVLSYLTGVIILIADTAHRAAGCVVAGLLFGPMIFAARVITLKNTHWGKTWRGLSGKEKGLAMPGLTCGSTTSLAWRRVRMRTPLCDLAGTSGHREWARPTGLPGAA